jgi:hypothetical protein
MKPCIIRRCITFRRIIVAKKDMKGNRKSQPRKTGFSWAELLQRKVICRTASIVANKDHACNKKPPKGAHGRLSA